MLDPRAVEVLANRLDLDDQDLADFASFATDNEAEQAAIVEQIKSARA
jgi:siroheme synthase (precorrin-2 oxidase/ferrochelatase)